MCIISIIIIIFFSTVYEFSPSLSGGTLLEVAAYLLGSLGLFLVF